MGVHDAGDAGREERDAARRAVGFGGFDGVPRGGAVGFRGHGPIHDGDADARLLPDGAVLHHPGNAAAAALAGPRVLAKATAAVLLLHGGADGALGVADGLFEAGAEARKGVGGMS